ncbi:MAG: hypothetical protein IK082_05035 [Oscillospiraceae bacterium]|nr:hypothetical protein [Oscillospiraceae bacterium]
MTYGVIFDDGMTEFNSSTKIDTKAKWGLILLSDLVVENPSPNINLVTVPGRSGAYDFSEVLGSVTYNTRTISFTLFKPAPDLTFEATRDEFTSLYNGKRVKLYLPTDSTHYYEGRVTVGGVSGYNRGQIAVTMIADPVKYAEAT